MPRQLYQTTYTPQLANAFVCRLSGGMTIAAVCREPGMPERRTVYGWMKRHPQFAALVAAARDPDQKRAPGGRRAPGYSEALAAGICAALAEGFALKEICDAPGFPVRYGTVAAWVKQRPDFAARYHAACAPRMTEGGLRIGRGRRGAYDPQFAHQIADRLIEGRSLDSIACDPDMPGTGVLAEWRARHPDFRIAMDRARRAQLDVLLDEVIAARDHPCRPQLTAGRLISAIWRHGHRPFGAAPVEAGGRNWAETVADGTRRGRRGAAAREGEARGSVRGRKAG